MGAYVLHRAHTLFDLEIVLRRIWVWELFLICATLNRCIGRRKDHRLLILGLDAAGALLFHFVKPTRTT
jgi:hypothetical protein